MTETARPALLRVPSQPATPATIPAALRSAWQAARGDAADVARALTINFIAVADVEHEPALRQTVDRLLQRSPARAFLLVIDDALREPQAEVAAVTRCHGSTRDVLLEEIVVRLPSSWSAHVPGLVRPLLINDLPNHLYWMQDWRDDAVFAALRTLSDHCVVDSGRFRLPAVQLGELEAARGPRTAITDLSWLRLRPWRRALAEAFEQVPWHEGLRVTGVVRHGAAGLAASILLAQWLETRLAGKIGLEESTGFTGPCPSAVQLRFGGCDIEVSSDHRCLVVHVTTPDRCLLPFRLPRSSGSDADLLAAAIDIA